MDASKHITPVDASSPLTAGEQQRGMRLAFWSQALGVHLYLFIGASAIAPLFIKRLGGSDLQAMMPSVLVGVLYLVQLPVALFVRPRDLRPFMIHSWLASSATMLVALFATAWIGPGQAGVWVLLAGIFMTLTLLYVGGTFWYPLLHDVVPAKQRGRFFGKLRAIWSIAYLALGVGAGIFLGNSAPVWKFIVVLVVVTLLQFLREPFIARIPHRAAAVDDDDWRDELHHLFYRPDLLAFCAYFTLLMFLAGFLGQPTVLYMRELGFSAGNNTLIYALSTIGSALALMVVGQLLDRIGTRRIFFSVHILLCALALCLAFSGELPQAFAGPLITLLLIGCRAALAAAELSNTAQIFYLAPARGKRFYLSLSMGVTYLGSAISPLASGLILDSSWRTYTLHLGIVDFGIFQLLFVVAGLGLLAATALLPLVADVHPSRPETTPADV